MFSHLLHRLWWRLVAATALGLGGVWLISQALAQPTPPAAAWAGEVSRAVLLPLGRGMVGLTGLAGQAALILGVALALAWGLPTLARWGTSWADSVAQEWETRREAASRLRLLEAENRELRHLLMEARAEIKALKAEVLRLQTTPPPRRRG